VGGDSRGVLLRTNASTATRILRFRKGFAMTPKPQPRPPRVDVIPVRASLIATVAIVCHDGDGAFRYHAVGAEQSWSGRVDAPSKEVAIVDAMAAIRANAPEMDQVRFLVSLQATTPLKTAV
jgi:hypothetical protein